MKRSSNTRTKKWERSRFLQTTVDEAVYLEKFITTLQKNNFDQMVYFGLCIRW